MQGEISDDREVGAGGSGADALRRHLERGLEAAESERVRYHLREALQLLEFAPRD